MSKTTAKDYRLFKDECRKWQQRLGLMSWELFFEHKDIEDRAQCEANGLAARMACLRLATEWEDAWDNKLTTDAIKKLALHEMLELFFWETRDMLQEHYSEYAIEREIHRLIRTLENTL